MFLQGMMYNRKMLLIPKKITVKGQMIIKFIPKRIATASSQYPCDLDSLTLVKDTVDDKVVVAEEDKEMG